MGVEGVFRGIMRRIYCKEEVCIGCRLCEVWCRIEHSKSKKVLKAFLYEKERAIQRVQVEERGAVSFALQCRHCEEPDCVYSCISGALYKGNEVVMHDTSRCVGCWSCVLACPYGVIAMDEVRGKAWKCDFCEGVGREEPICVEKCPNEALRLALVLEVEHAESE